MARLLIRWTLRAMAVATLIVLMGLGGRNVTAPGPFPGAPEAYVNVGVALWVQVVGIVAAAVLAGASFTPGLRRR